MRLYTALKNYLNCLNDNDIKLFTNYNLSKAAYELNHSNSNVYSSYDNPLTCYMAIGIATQTNKRVFIFTRENDFIKDMSVPLQIAEARLKNIFYIIFNTSNHEECNNYPSALNNIYGLKGVLFNMGVIVHDYTNYLKNRGSIKTMNNIIDNLIGPLATIINVDNQTCNYKDIPDDVYDLYKLNKFIHDEDKGTSMFYPFGLM